MIKPLGAKSLEARGEAASTIYVIIGYAPRGHFKGGNSFLGVISLESMVVPSPKIVVNLPGENHTGSAVQTNRQTEKQTNILFLYFNEIFIITL